MTAPTLAARNLGWALALGICLGLVYGLLRPLRRRHTHLWDAAFILCTAAAWVYLSFGICLPGGPSG